MPQAEEMENLQLGEDHEIDLMTRITPQADQVTENLEAEKQVEEEDLGWAQQQYPTPDPSVWKLFLQTLLEPRFNLKG